MEKQLKCVLLLSLKDMALRRVAVLLGSGSDFLAFFLKFRNCEFYREEAIKEWRETVEKIKDKMLKLEIPESLTKQMIGIIRPIGVLISRWKTSQEDYLSNKKEEISLSNSATLFWTTAGLIDYRKTAEELLRCDALNVVQRYKLACINCMEDNIPLMWEELPEESKECFIRSEVLSPSLPSCWPRILKGELTELDSLWRTSNGNLTSFNQWAFEHSVEYGNKTAAEYFFQKLTHKERETSLMRTVEAVLRKRFIRYIPRNEELSILLSYLLSLITPEQQMELVKARSIDFFHCFLDCPWPDLFLENLGLIWTFLPPSTYDQLLPGMARRYENSDPYFPKLFQEFFMQSPLDFKKWFVDQESEFRGSIACRFLDLFITSEDSESIEIMFRNVVAADRVRLVSRKDVLRLFYTFVLSGRWPMVEVCLREATLSQEDKERLKEALMGWRSRYIRPQSEYGSQNLKRLFEFLDETDASADEEKKDQKCKLGNCSPE